MPKPDDNFKVVHHFSNDIPFVLYKGTKFTKAFSDFAIPLRVLCAFVREKVRNGLWETV